MPSSGKSAGGGTERNFSALFNRRVVSCDEIGLSRFVEMGPNVSLNYSKKSDRLLPLHARVYDSASDLHAT